MNNNLILTGVLSFLLLSCDNNSDSFKEYDLTSKKKVFSQILNPEKIRLKSNYLIILESTSIDNFNSAVHLVDRKKMEFLYSVGKMGFGPGEISDAFSVDFNESDSVFYIYSAVDKKISEFPFKKVELATFQVKQRNDFFKAYSILGFTDSTYLGLTVDSPARLIEFNKNGDSISSFGKLENFSVRKDLDYFNLSQLNMGWFSTNEKKTHFAIASIFTNRIEIFDRSANKINYLYQMPKEHTKFDLLPEASGYSVHWDLTSPYHYRDIVLTNSYIFALYGGYSEKEIQSNSVIAKTVFVYSLQGELIAKFNLDSSISSLSVDENLTKLYGISTDSDPGVVEFDLPRFLED